MIISSTGFVDGSIASRFGKYADATDMMQNIPIRSIPIAWSRIPVGTISLALVMLDHDAIPVCGFSWIHWTVLNIDPSRNELAENASRNDVDLIQGKNSLASRQVCGELLESVTNFYSGPRPPDKEHEYEITVYALDSMLNLRNGFWLNELLHLMHGHILDSASLYGVYRV